MNKLVVIAVIFLVCVSLSTGEPTCYDQVCPQGTTNCKKNVRSSPDKKSLEIRINCLDDFDGSLKEYFFQEASIMNPHTHYESSSYSAAGGISDNYYRGNNDLEDFLK